MNILTKLFGKTGKQAHLHIDHPDGIPISPEEVKRLNDQYAAEVKSLAPLQEKLKGDTAMLRKVVDGRLSPGDRRKVAEMLRSGEDPLLLAAYLKVPFKLIAVIANDILKEAYGNRPDAPQISTDVQKYIVEAKRLEIAANGS